MRGFSDRKKSMPNPIKIQDYSKSWFEPAPEAGRQSQEGFRLPQIRAVRNNGFSGMALHAVKKNRYH